MNLIEAMKQNNLVINTKGGKYYKETYNSSLDELKYEIKKIILLKKPRVNVLNIINYKKDCY